MDDPMTRARPPEDEAAVVAVARRVMAEPPRSAAAVALIILCVLAVFYTLYLTAELVLPIVLALVLKMFLQPGMRFLTLRLRLPTVIAALCMIAAMLGGIAAILGGLVAPAADWISKGPRSVAVLEERLHIVKQPIELVQDAIKRIEGLAKNSHEGAPAVAVQDSGLSGLIFRGTRDVLGELVILIVVLFFMLSAGDTLLRRLVEILPTFGDKKRAVEIVSEIEQNISIYLLTITTMNALVGVATGLVMWLCGVPDPILWAAVAFLLNYVPILGPLSGVIVFFLVGLLTFETIASAFVPAAAYLAIHVAEGETITPMLLARRFTLNPVLVIVALFFWHWMWGVPGALLAVPLLAIAKIVADRIPELTPLGHLLGSGPRDANGRAGAAGS
jgi:predicted PurR-regulated permease PerM